MRNGCANFVAPHSALTGMYQNAFALENVVILAGPSVVRVQNNAGRQTVYNLAVDECPEYFANGVLVHNCDPLRYFVNSLPKWRVGDV